MQTLTASPLADIPLALKLVKYARDSRSSVELEGQ